METWDVVVVGAGVCGLTIAQNLQERGRSVLLLDKGSRPGGRMASRPLGGRLLDPSVDTVRSHDAKVTREVTRRTDARFAAEIGGYADWTFDAPAGDIAKRWAAGTTLRRTFITHLAMQNSGLIHVVPHASGEPFRGRAVVLTAPVPQSVQILRTSGFDVAPPLLEVAYDKRDVLLCLVDGAGDRSVGDRLASSSTYAGAIEMIRVRHRADAGQVWLEVFANPLWSEARWETDATFSQAALLTELIRLLPGVRVVESELKRWRYANAVRTVESPDTVPGAPYYRSEDQPGVFVAGDGFGCLHGHPSGVSRAVRSGLDVARDLRG